MSYNPQNPNGQAAMAASSPVVIASNQSTLPVNLTPSSAGGLLVSTGSVGGSAGTSIKATAGQVYGWYIYNNNAGVSYVNFYNTNTAPTSGGTTTLFFSLGIPANGGANVFIPQGIAFSSGIGIAITTLRNGTIAPTAPVDYNIYYT